MKCSLEKTFVAALFALALVVSAAYAPDAAAQTQRRRRVSDPVEAGDAKRMNEAAKKAASAARVFEEIMSAPDNTIPRELLDRAEAVAVFPGVLKAGFVIGGRGGSGVISRRVRDGWSAPAFFKMGGASVGAQIGASKTDFVLLFMNEGALRGLLQDKIEMGGEASAAAGPVGRSASATTNLTLDAGILSYSRSKGAFVGLEIKGAVVNPDNHLNEAIYDRKANGLLSGTQPPEMANVFQGVHIFPLTLTRYSRR